MPTSLKGWCVHCRGRIDVPAERRDLSIQCPHCGGEMIGWAALASRQYSRPSRGWLWLCLSLLVLLGLGVLAYWKWMLMRAGFELLTEETGGRTAAIASLVFGLVALLWLILWLLFPILVYVGLRDLRRRTADLDESTRLCALHLARLSSDRDQAQNSKRAAPDQPA